MTSVTSMKLMHLNNQFDLQMVTEIVLEGYNPNSIDTTNFVISHPSPASDENLIFFFKLQNSLAMSTDLKYIYVFQYLFSNFIKLYFPLFDSFCQSYMH